MREFPARSEGDDGGEADGAVMIGYSVQFYAGGLQDKCVEDGVKSVEGVDVVCATVGDDKEGDGEVGGDVQEEGGD